MTVFRKSHCKVNLLLNVLARRPDGFHELETVMQPVNVFDELTFEYAPTGIHLSCSDDRLPCDSGNLVHRAAAAFLGEAKIRDGVRIQLDKNIPLSAGLGGGSGNAAVTLLGLNELFDECLTSKQLSEIAVSLGSDVPFFLQSKPALATGHGQKIEPLDPFPGLHNSVMMLIHPGFGISTAWAYGQLVKFPAAVNGLPGRARALVNRLQKPDLRSAAGEFYNSLEAPALRKYPILALYQEFLKAHGALATLMSGSGSTTFGIFQDLTKARSTEAEFRLRFGNAGWICVLPV